MTSLVEIYRRFPTKEACIAHLEKVRWPEGPRCPYCGDPRASHNRDSSRGATAERWKCQSPQCLRSYSVTVHTIFHATKVDLQKWFLLIALMLNAKKGLSAKQAERDLDVSYETAWSMMHRIRAAMDDDGRLLTGLVEMDEAYVGGKPRRKNRKDDNDPKPRGRATRKTPIVGAVERGGRVKAKMVIADEMTAADMEAIAREMIDCRTATVTTDEYSGYNSFNNFVAHRRVNHSTAYVEYDLFGAKHTNTIEGFWALVKRAIHGQFHHVSRKYLPLYLRELSYRYNGRHDASGLDGVLHLAVNPGAR